MDPVGDIDATDTSIITYIAFTKNNNSGNDYVAFREVGSSNNIKFAIDFHDDGDDVDFVLRDWKTSGTDTTPVERFSVNASGTCQADDFNASSDIRLKENIVPIENALDKVMKLNGKQYNWKKDEEKKLHSGLIAQEVEEIIPEVVNTRSNKETEENDENGIKSINYNGIVPYLVECIKEMKNEINELKNEIDVLKKI